MEGEKPTNHASVKLLVVPVLPATGYFKPAAVAQLAAKASSGAAIGETDDMALAGILSTQLVHHQFIANFTAGLPLREDRNDIKTCGLCLATNG